MQEGGGGEGERRGETERGTQKNSLIALYIWLCRRVGEG